MPDVTDPPLRRTLHCHPTTPCTTVLTITVQVAAVGARTLALRYRIAGDISRLRVPPAGAPLAPDRLWETTCCELFAAASEGPTYCEWNFSPSGASTRFAFSDYRVRSGAPQPAQCALHWERTADGFSLATQVILPVALGTPVQIGLATVLQDVDGVRSYWALVHGADRPDFHHRDGFALPLSPLDPP